MREKIIDTAIEEFTRNGLKFTMNDVAKALGISKKTIYTVFESKQDVLMAIADRYARDFTDMRQEIEADTELDTMEKLERLDDMEVMDTRITALEAMVKKLNRDVEKLKKAQ